MKNKLKTSTLIDLGTRASVKVQNGLFNNLLILHEAYYLPSWPTEISLKLSTRLTIINDIINGRKRRF